MSQDLEELKEIYDAIEAMGDLPDREAFICAMRETTSRYERLPIWDLELSNNPCHGFDWAVLRWDGEEVELEEAHLSGDGTCLRLLLRWPHHGEDWLPDLRYIVFGGDLLEVRRPVYHDITHDYMDGSMDMRRSLVAVRDGCWFGGWSGSYERSRLVRELSAPTREEEIPESGGRTVTVTSSGWDTDLRRWPSLALPSDVGPDLLGPTWKPGGCPRRYEEGDVLDAPQVFKSKGTAALGIAEDLLYGPPPRGLSGSDGEGHR